MKKLFLFLFSALTMGHIMAQDGMPIQMDSVEAKMDRSFKEYSECLKNGDFLFTERDETVIDCPIAWLYFKVAKHKVLNKNLTYCTLTINGNNGTSILNIEETKALVAALQYIVKVKEGLTPKKGTSFSFYSPNSGLRVEYSAKYNVWENKYDKWELDILPDKNIGENGYIKSTGDVESILQTAEKALQVIESKTHGETIQN